MGENADKSVVVELEGIRLGGIVVDKGDGRFECANETGGVFLWRARETRRHYYLWRRLEL